tara:strand:- start:587 stop:1213 length:627 start_codon:yes stop_codon:yes gene_type:complete
MKETLKELYNTGLYNDSDKGTIHSYMDSYYSKEFTPKKDEKLNFVEIGVRGGGSIRLWRDWFTNSKITGIDNNNDNITVQSIGGVNFTTVDKRVKGDVTLIDGDAYDDNIVNIFEDNSIDYLIDDGPHTIESQLDCVKKYFRKIKPGGKIIIEDLQVPPPTHGSVEQFVEKFKQLELFKTTPLNLEILDLRNVKNQYDDVLFIFNKNI